MKKQSYKLIICILLTAFFSCTTNHAVRSFEREKELQNYFSKIQETDISNQKESYIAIFQDGFCGACTIEAITFLNNFFNQNNKEQPKLIVCSPAKENMLKQKFKDVPNVQFFIDKDEKLSRYGLVYTQDLLFKIKNGKVIDWSLLPPYPDKLARIGKRMGA